MLATRTLIVGLPGLTAHRNSEPCNTSQADPELGFAALAAHAGCPTTGSDGLACLRALPLRAPPGQPEPELCP